MAHGGRFRIELKHSGLFWLWCIKDSENHFQIVNSGTATTKLGAKWLAKRTANRRVKRELTEGHTFEFDY